MSLGVTTPYDSSVNCNLLIFKHLYTFLYIKIHKLTNSYLLNKLKKKKQAII